MPDLEFRETTSPTVTLQELQHTVPKKARVEMEKALKAARKHELEQELDHLKKAVLIDPKYVIARNNLAVRLLATDPVSAIAHWEEAIKVDPHKGVLFSNLASAYFRTRDLEAAERAARTAMALDRTSIQVRGTLGLVLYERGKYTAETVALLERATHEYPMTHVFAAGVLLARGELTKARIHLQAYLSSGELEYHDFANQLLHAIELRGTPGQFGAEESGPTELSRDAEREREYPPSTSEIAKRSDTN